jgi:uncharacterized protein YukE
MSNIEFNKEGVESILKQIEAKNNNIKEILENVELMSGAFDGNEDTWKGKGQESFYESYKTIAKKFQTINEKLDDNVNFIRNMMDNYVNGEDTIDKNVDKF